MKRPLLAIVILLSTAVTASGSLHAQCYGSLMLSSTYFEFNYLARLAVHFGDASSVPSDIICSRGMLPSETVADVPIWAYNLHEGAEYFEFSIASNESIAVFIPDNCISVVGSWRWQGGSDYRLDLALQACSPLCGPLRLGWAQIIRVSESDPVWIDLRPNAQTSKMFTMDCNGSSHNMFSPQHGGYLGQAYLYSCQEPICEEPNEPVSAFAAAKGSGCSVKLTWTAGSGNRTMIRFRTDRYPTGTADGELAVETPSVPGENQYFFHTEITPPVRLYYKAFSLTRDAGGTILRDSFVECGSVGVIDVECEIATEESSWGAIKSIYR